MEKERIQVNKYVVLLMFIFSYPDINNNNKQKQINYYFDLYRKMSTFYNYFSKNHWKIELEDSIQNHDITKFNSILRRPEVQNEMKTVSDWKSLHLTVKLGHDDMLEKLLEFGSNPDVYCDEDGVKKHNGLI